MDRYMSQIRKAVEQAGQRITVYNWNETLGNKTVVAFGTGKFFADTHERLFRMVDVKFVCDNDPSKWGKEFFGKKCISPEEMAGIENVFVIIVLGNCREVMEQLKDRGIPSIHISEMHFSYYEKGKDVTWLNDAMPQIEEALQLFKDEESKDIFTKVFCNKIYVSETETPYHTFARGGEYFDNGLWTLGDDEYFVDGGAYIGDTVEDFLNQTKGKFGKVYSFEYEVCNYRKLNENMDRFEPEIRAKIETYQIGIWNDREESWCDYFGESDGTQILKPGEKTETAEKCLLDKLDDVLAGEKVTVLKLDIEGAEIQGLTGSEKILREQKPKLAVCLYHRPEDLWEIPLTIKKLNPKYEMLIRHHGSQNFTDTVLYAV